MKKKYLLGLLMLCVFPLFTQAQTYFTVNTLSGQQTVGGVTVTVSTIGAPGTQLSCGISPYYVQSGGYKYSFSSSVFTLRIHFIAINYDDTVRMSINGSPYTITASNIANYPNSCLSGPMNAFIYNGNIVGIGSGLYGVQFDLTSTSSIDTFLIYQNTFSSGWVYDFSFADPCPGHINATATHDSVCVGDPIDLFANATGVTGSATYSWTGPNTFVSGNINPTLANVGTLATGTYSLVVHDTGTCTYYSNVNVVVNTLITSISASSNGPLCPGDSLKLFSPAYTNTSYNWSGPGPFTSTVQNPVTPFTIADTGIYTIVATNGCNSLSATTHVGTTQPGIPYITYVSPVCSGHTLNLAANSSTSGCTYQWTGPSFSTSGQNPSIPNVSTSNSGNYSVVATSQGCTNVDTVAITIYKTPSAPTVGSNSPLCAGDTLKLTASDTSSGIAYTWNGPGPYFSSLQNPIVLNTTTAGTGTYSATATVTATGCSASNNTYVLINPVIPPPTIHISSSPGDTMCNGTPLLFTSSNTNATNPTYQWRDNGADIVGATGATLSTGAINNGDIITCKIRSYATCQTNDSGISNSRHISVISLPPPLVALSFFPTTYISGTLVTFTGHVPAGDTGLTYSWKKNGVFIPGAHGISYATSNLAGGDTICLVVYTSVKCTVPDSVLTCRVLALGINNINAGLADLQLFPNPNSGSFTISGTINEDKQATIEVLNPIGQVVYKTVARIINGNLDHKVQMSRPAAGVYFVKINWSQGSYTQRIVIY